MNKKIYRPREGRVLVGVCAGIAAYFNLDPVLIRLGWIIFCCLWGSGILAYLVAAVLIPEEPEF
ncbi:MAG: PspC domain-containing protein [Firmicutes bacterium]|nr:PspC domain-containing protein [Bacillota bacterium]MDY6159946.1 PspC domain-containing protein [Candidatus Faecousia sp.]